MLAAQADVAWTIEGALKAWRETRPAKAKPAADRVEVLVRRIEQTKQILMRLEVELAEERCGVAPQSELVAEGGDEPGGIIVDLVETTPQPDKIEAKSVWSQPPMNRHDRRRNEAFARKHVRLVPLEMSQGV